MATFLFGTQDVCVEVCMMYVKMYSVYMYVDTA